MCCLCFFFVAVAINRFFFRTTEVVEAFTRNTAQRATFSTHLTPKNPVVYRSLRGTTTVNIPDDNEPETPPPSWLRNSMRHLEHLILPSEVEVINVESVEQREEDVRPVSVIVVHNVVRPVSAPSVLMQNEHSGDVERSCSTSTRSRRPRSVSSVSSFGSSVESTPSGTPEPTPQRNGQQESNNARRYALNRLGVQLNKVKGCAKLLE